MKVNRWLNALRIHANSIKNREGEIGLFLPMLFSVIATKKDEIYVAQTLPFLHGRYLTNTRAKINRVTATNVRSPASKAKSHFPFDTSESASKQRNYVRYTVCLQHDTWRFQSTRDQVRATKPWRCAHAHFLLFYRMLAHALGVRSHGWEKRTFVHVVVALVARRSTRRSARQTRTGRNDSY